jgi:hypothetical protein
VERLPVRATTLYIVAAGVGFVLIASGVAFFGYEGSIGPFLLFNVSYSLLLLLAVPKPRLYAYTFLALLLFLGFWVKFTAHVILRYPFVEPVGDFDGSGASWDIALLVASSAALGAAFVRALHLLYARRAPARIDVRFDASNVPPWYSQFARPVWIGTLLLLLAIVSWNMFAGFYQVGVEPRVVLPAHLNAVFAWAIHIGFALWIATLVYWEVSRARGRVGYVLLVPLAEGFVSTITMLSRAAYLFHTLPYFFVLVERGSELRSALTRRAMVALTLLFVLGFAASLIAVTGLRIYIYPAPTLPPAQPVAVYTLAPVLASPAPTPPQATAVDTSTPEQKAPAASSPAETPDADVSRQYVIGMARQVLGLFIDRWIGLEGVLAVSSYDRLGYDLLIDAVREDPDARMDSIYQEVSEAPYQELEGFSSLTLPGAVAVLYYSGSLLVVAGGTTVIFLIAMVVESIAARFIGNPFLLATSGLGMANVVAQMNFPYLAGIFLLELLVTLFFIWLLQNFPASLWRRGRHSPRRRWSRGRHSVRRKTA